MQRLGLFRHKSAIFVFGVGGLLIAQTVGCRRAAGADSRASGAESPQLGKRAGAQFAPTRARLPNDAAPRILYTDALAGPNSGGENDKGMYLSIFGMGFGNSGIGKSVKVFIGDVEVDNYRYLGASRGRPDVEQITVQVGALGSPKPGVPLPIKVVVNGVASNTDHAFTVQPGDFFFVSTSGNDATAAKNDINRPFRLVQTPREGGVLALMSPGDVIVLRGGPNVIWSDVGFENRWFRFRRAAGNEPTGAKGHGYLSIVAYPNEEVRYVPPPNTSGGIHGVGDSYPQYSDWIMISGLRIESVSSSETDAGPINLQAASDHWRVINNELGPWPAPESAGCKAGGVVGNGKHVAILGNHIHHIGGGKQNHGIYLDSNSTDIEVAYNSIHDIASGNLIQMYDNIGGAPLNDIRIHHNVIYNGGRFGLNIADGTHTFSAWNNVIYSTAQAGVRLNVDADASTSISIVHNTIYDTNLLEGGGNAPIVNNWNLGKGRAIIANNIIALGPNSRGGAYFADTADSSAIKFQHNLWFGRRKEPPAQDKNPVGGGDRTEPKFASVARGDFSLLPGSPAIDQAEASAPERITDDFAMRARPAGGRADVGAFEFAAPSAQGKP